MKKTTYYKKFIAIKQVQNIPHSKIAREENLAIKLGKRKKRSSFSQIVRKEYLHNKDILDMQGYDYQQTKYSIMTQIVTDLEREPALNNKLEKLLKAKIKKTGDYSLRVEDLFKVFHRNGVRDLDMNKINKVLKDIGFNKVERINAIGEAFVRMGRTREFISQDDINIINANNAGFLNRTYKYTHDQNWQWNSDSKQWENSEGFAWRYEYSKGSSPILSQYTLYKKEYNIKTKSMEWDPVFTKGVENEKYKDYKAKRI